MSDTAPVIDLEQLNKVFYTDEVETHALSDVRLQIVDGDYVAITGPSGCGKSTLLSIVGLLDTATSGEYRLRGRPVLGVSQREQARLRNQELGFVFQNFNLIGELTVRENLELPLLYRRVDRAARCRAVDEMLERVGMGHRANHYPGHLSGGQQQRVAVARALVGKPAILLADEPTGNLDSRNGESIMELLAGLHRSGTTICLVTHNPQFAAQATRTVHLLDGRIVA
jgi:putative ABC transport system ATP-binding protein